MNNIRHNLFVILDAPYTQRKYLESGQFHHIDLKSLADAPNWAEKFDYEGLPCRTTKIIALEHLEYKMDDPEANRQKTCLLEKLLAGGHRVIVISAADPTRYRLTDKVQDKELGAHVSRASEALDRWAGVISRFFKVYAEDTGDKKCFAEAIEAQRHESSAQTDQTSRPQYEIDELLETLKQECAPKGPLQHVGMEILQQDGFKKLTREHLINRVMIQASTFYQNIWDSCSNEERLTLFHLAQDRLLSHNDPEIEQLLRRGLIVRDPDIHLLNESFRRFVKSEKGGQVMAEYEDEAKKGSQWQFLKTPLLVVLLSVILFLFITQRELYNSSLAIMTAITTAIPAFFKVLSLFQKDPVNYPVQPNSAAHVD